MRSYANRTVTSEFELRAIMQEGGKGKELVPAEITIRINHTLDNAPLVKQLHEACMSRKLVGIDIGGVEASAAVITTKTEYD